MISSKYKLVNEVPHYELALTHKPTGTVVRGEGPSYTDTRDQLQALLEQEVTKIP